MRNKIRELTDRNKGISNAEREKKYQDYVRGWVEYFRLADMKNLLKKTDEWARRRIRAGLLETVEENQNEIQDVKSTWNGTLESEGTCL